MKIQLKHFKNPVNYYRSRRRALKIKALQELRKEIKYKTFVEYPNVHTPPDISEWKIIKTFQTL